MKIIISESQFRRLIENKNLLTEADSRIKKTEKIIRNAFNGILNVDNTVSNGDYYVNGNPNTTWLQYLIFNLRHTLGLMTNQDVALLPNAANIAYNDLHFDTDNQDLNKMGIFRRMLDIIKSKQEDIQAFIKSQPTFDSLYQLYGKTIEEMDAEMKDRVNNKKYEGNQNYEIIRIDNREEAHKYGQYSGAEGSGELCYTMADSTWDNFTQDGVNTCYLCLRKDWKNIPCQVGEGYPKDEYGTSMIFLFVDEKGNLKYSNSRWNHGDNSYGNVDTMFTPEEISDIIGVNFYQTFKPSNKWKEVISQCQERLKNGENPSSVFDYCYSFREGFALVELRRKYNFINTNGEIISNQWFDECYNFRKGFAKVILNEKYNFINTNGEIISNQWFDYCDKFIDGFAKVILNGRWFYLDGKGNLYDKNRQPINRLSESIQRNLRKAILNIL